VRLGGSGSETDPLPTWLAMSSPPRGDAISGRDAGHSRPNGLYWEAETRSALWTRRSRVRAVFG
jgi:hypothetical protein